MDPQFSVRFERRRGAVSPHAPSGAELRPGGLDEVEALRLLRRSASPGAADPDYHFILGEALLRAGRYGEAVSALSRASAARPEDADYRLTLGQALWAGAQYQEASRAFRAAADLRPDDADAWNGLGASLIQIGDSEAALAALGEAQCLDATRPETHSNLGVARWRQGDGEPSLAHFRAATRVTGAPGWIYHNLARALTASGQLAPAIRSLREAVRLAPDNAEAHADLGDALLAAGRGGEAEAAYQQAVGLSPAVLEQRPASQTAYRSLVTQSIRAELAVRRSTLRRVLGTAGLGLVGVLSLGLRLLRRPVGLVFVGLPALAVLFALVRVAPQYVSYLLFRDDMASAAMAPVEDDFDVRERLSHAVEKRGLSDRVSVGECVIEVRRPWRTITCRYEASVTPLPGWRMRLRFRPSVERPFVAAPKPIIL